MEDKRKYHIIIGSKAYFDTSLPMFTEDDVVDTFLELVKLSDTAKQNRLIFEQHADILIIKNNNYHGIVEAAHDRLGPLIEELTTDDAEIYIHNPPRVLKEYLEEQHKRSLIELDIVSEEYEMIFAWISSDAFFVLAAAFFCSSSFFIFFFLAFVARGERMFSASRKLVIADTDRVMPSILSRSSVKCTKLAP